MSFPREEQFGLLDPERSALIISSSIVSKDFFLSCFCSSTSTSHSHHCLIVKTAKFCVIIASNILLLLQSVNHAAKLEVVIVLRSTQCLGNHVSIDWSASSLSSNSATTGTAESRPTKRQKTRTHTAGTKPDPFVAARTDEPGGRSCDQKSATDRVPLRREARLSVDVRARRCAARAAVVRRPPSGQ